MNSRDAILGRIRKHLANEPAVEEPPVPEVWPRTNPSTDAMATRFAEELQAISGEVIRCASMEEARAKLAELMKEGGWETLGAVDRPLCRELAGGLAAEQVAWAKPEWTPGEMATLPVGLVEADYLLADTGTAMVACGRAEERLLCYLPPACIVAATADRLVEHMPAVWGEVARRAADPALRGELVFITGPSRTADIEKILILGVHGPKRLIVLIVG
jgi:L-lactate dehydrogenase complex protein LldG